MKILTNFIDRKINIWACESQILQSSKNAYVLINLSSAPRGVPSVRDNLFQADKGVGADL
jgi:hypothetical protein